jgi:hypothetical protein
MKQYIKQPAVNIVIRIILRTLQRFNPFCKPLIPMLLVFYTIALLFSGLYLYDRMLNTLVTEYRELALSAWGFLLLLNFMESLMEGLYDQDHEH